MARRTPGSRGKGGPRPWVPSALDVDKASEAIKDGSSIEDMVIVQLMVAPSTYFQYARQFPQSELVQAIARAKALRRVRLGAKVSRVAETLGQVDEKGKITEHPKAFDAAKFILARQGGDDWKEKIEVTGNGAAPLSAVVEFIPRSNTAKPKPKPRT